MVARTVRRGYAGCELRDPAAITTSVDEVRFALVQQICAMKMQLISLQL